MTAQVATGATGLWLVVSSTLWRHSTFQRQNSIACGFLAIVLALGSSHYRELASLGALLAMWLYLSAILPPTLYPVTAWSNILSAIVIWVASVAGGYHAQREQ